MDKLHFRVLTLLPSWCVKSSLPVVPTPFIRKRGKRETVSCEVAFSDRNDWQLRPLYARRQNGGTHQRIWGSEGRHSRRSVFGGPRADVSSRVSRLSGMCCDFMLVTHNVALFYSLRIVHSNGWGRRAFPGCKHFCRLQAGTADDDRNVGSQRGTRTGNARGCTVMLSVSWLSQ